MHRLCGRLRLAVLPFLFAVVALNAHAQSSATSGTIAVTVTDPTGAALPGATVTIHNAVSGFSQTAVTGATGQATFYNVPFNPYHLSATVQGFQESAQDVNVRSTVPLDVTVKLAIEGVAQTVTVEANGADLIENTPSFHTDVDRSLFSKLPLESKSSDLSSLVTLSTPGVAADSNGLFHGLGDHAENSFSVDGQPITDQQSKVFSNQIPLDSVESMEVVSGAPPAEYGEKASVVINVTTRSGQNVTTPHGAVTYSYGSFGTSVADFNLAYGGKSWGNFFSVSGLQSGRFLDPPEFTVMHAKGNEENAFDRVDYQLSGADFLHFNLGYTRSWFQNPNSFDNLNLGVVDPLLGLPVGQADQRSQINTYNFAPSWTHTINQYSLVEVGAFARHDGYHYYPSGNPFVDLSPTQQESVAQSRQLTDAGLRADLSYARGVNNLKVGATFQHWFLHENDRLGIVDPLLNAPCLDATGAAQPGFNDPAQCAGAGFFPNDSANPLATSPFVPVLGCLDLTRPVPSSADACVTSVATPFLFRGNTDVKLLSFYAQDAITKGPWTINLGVRDDQYNGFVSHNEVQPRLGISSNIKRTGTVLRVSYARLLETPFNENLIVSSTGCNFAVLASLVPCVPAPLGPGWRNEFHAGLEQAFGKYLVFSGEYINKYTHNGYDFSDLGNTPIFFPIEWHNSKIPAIAGRASVPNFHGFTALFVFSHVVARYFPPQTGGLGVTVGQGGLPFRIDHDEAFNQTTHFQYQFPKKGPWIGFNWRYDSGLVAGAVPFATDTTTPVDLTGLTGDQQMQAGLFCGNQFPTLSAPLTTCAPNLYGSTLISLPAPGTENDDKNPPRVAPRHLFDLALGDDNLFHAERYQWSARFTVINLTDQVALYNFLSTFSGTHYVTPRAYTAEVGFHF